MGCELSKLNRNVCKHSETAKTHVDYIKEHGMAKYNKIMELDPRMPYENINKSIDDHSSSFNVGLVDLENSSETETSNASFYESVTWRQLIEITIGCMIVIYLIVKVKKFLKKSYGELSH